MSFYWYDYTLFLLTLISSTFIGVYFVSFGKRQQTIDEFLFGSKDMKLIPICLSLISSGVNAFTLMDVSSEVYVNGFYYELCFGLLFTMIIPYYTCLPVFFAIKVTSVYQYLEMRFNKKLRLTATVFYLINMIIWLPFHIYLPTRLLQPGNNFFNTNKVSRLLPKEMF